MPQFTENSTIGDVKKYFGGDAGRLLFPVDRPFEDTETLSQITNSGHYLWYSDLNVSTTVALVNSLAKQQAVPPFSIIFTANKKLDSTRPDETLEFIYFLVSHMLHLQLTMLVVDFTMSLGCRIVSRMQWKSVSAAIMLLH